MKFTIVRMEGFLELQVGNAGFKAPARLHPTLFLLLCGDQAAEGDVCLDRESFLDFEVLSLFL